MNLKRANPFFSIILPTYNRSNFLPYAIESVIKQSYNSWELIIVDDGSTDNTKSIVTKFQRKDKRIFYFFQKNQERSSARNNGIKNSTGIWICFLDSDDIYHSNHLHVFKKFLEKNNFKLGLYFSGLSKEAYEEANEVYNESFQDNVEFIILNILATPRACVSKKILLENLFDEKISIGEDQELWARILSKYPLFFHYKKTIIQKNHTKRSVNQDSEFTSLVTLKKILYNKSYKLRPKIKRQAMSNAYFNISKHYILKKQTIKAMLFIIISITKNPLNPQTKHKLLLFLSLLKLHSSIYKEYQKRN